jgi:hypothetical protein
MAHYIAGEEEIPSSSRRPELRFRGPREEPSKNIVPQTKILPLPKDVAMVTCQDKVLHDLTKFLINNIHIYSSKSIYYENTFHN